MAELPTPQEVAATFVQGYYKVLHDAPGELHKFYQDSSMVSRPRTDGTMISFTTMEEIKKHVLSSIDCKECDIFSFDAQPSANNGVFVLVVGRFTTNNDDTRKFNQTFLLTPMEKVYGYFVSNDVLRFLDEQETINMRIGNEAVPKKKSFLSVVHALTENTAPFKPPPAKTPSIRTAPKETNPNIKSGVETSIFVGNLAADSKPEELYEAFKIFGAIEHNGVQVRTDKNNRWFAFIQFESSDSAQNAIQASSIRIRNRKLNIQEKKRNNDFRNHKFSQGSINGNGKGNGHDNFRGSRNFTRGNGADN